MDAQRGARTHDPEIKSLMLYRLSQQGGVNEKCRLQLAIDNTIPKNNTVEQEAITGHDDRLKKPNVLFLWKKIAPS